MVVIYGDDGNGGGGYIYSDDGDGSIYVNGAGDTERKGASAIGVVTALSWRGEAEA